MPLRVKIIDENRLQKINERRAKLKANGEYSAAGKKQVRRKDKFRKEKIKRLPKTHKKARSKAENLTKQYLASLPYQEFLKTKYWQRVRAIVLKRDKYKCVICKNNGELHVHHDTYKNHGEELRHLEDLMTLCSKCHTEHHYAQK